MIRGGTIRGSVGSKKPFNVINVADDQTHELDPYRWNIYVMKAWQDFVAEFPAQSRVIETLRTEFILLGPLHHMSRKRRICCTEHCESFRRGDVTSPAKPKVSGLARREVAAAKVPVSHTTITFPTGPSYQVTRRFVRNG